MYNIVTWVEFERMMRKERAQQQFTDFQFIQIDSDILNFIIFHLGNYRGFSFTIILQSFRFPNYIN